MRRLTAYFSNISWRTFLSTINLRILVTLVSGHETKAMLNNRGPRYKRTKQERKINRDVIWCVILLLFLCFFCAIGELDSIRNLCSNILCVSTPFFDFMCSDTFCVKKRWDF